jgi:hypothetical protein
VAFNDPVNRGQPNPGAGKLRLGVQALERCEQAIGERRVEPDTIVADDISRFVVDLVRRQFDLGVLDAGCELPCVTQQVVQHDT